MNTNQLKRFAKEARIKLLDQVGRKLEFVLTHDTAELRGKEKEITQLKNKIQQEGKEQVIEMVAYTWFNRIMAFRFMDANGYTIPKVVTPLAGMTNPEILQNALGGNIEADLQLDRQRLNDLLDGKTAATDAHAEAYKMLLVASCNQWHSAMPFMFERISDYTELLLPDDLLSDYSIVAEIRNGMSEEDCQQEELIGWLYQFYIADKKDEVYASKGRINKKDIPAATQLFTPRWIVRYMVENTLGKLWLSLKPNSRLRQYMPYYIETPEGNAPAPLPQGITSVTDVTFLDPCQGSGHVLVYAFDLFTKIYEEEGFNTNEIPELIIQHNLFGIDIDERAVQLAAFALSMKARSYNPRFLRKPAQPHVLALASVSEEAIHQALKFPIIVKGKKITSHKNLTLNLLTQADNFGSLIHIESEEIAFIEIQIGSIWQEQQQMLKKQGEYLSRQYHCVVTNPPYMGAGNMNKELSDFVKNMYSETKADLMACFMEAGLNLLMKKGFLGMINQQGWMFLGKFSDLRKKITENILIESLLQLGPRTFPEIGGEVVQNCSFVLNKSTPTLQSIFFDLTKQNTSELKRINFLDSISKSNFFIIDQKKFRELPNFIFGYWISEKVSGCFSKYSPLEKSFIPKQGMATSNNERFLRTWNEVKFEQIGLNMSDRNSARNSFKRWFPYNKGGQFRKWFGNNELVVNWEKDGEEIKKYREFKNSVLESNMGVAGLSDIFKTSISWSLISDANSFGVRYIPKGFLFDVNGLSIFPEEQNTYVVLAFMNSKVSNMFLNILNPTLAIQAGDVRKLPLADFDAVSKSSIDELAKECLDITKDEWDSKETSYDFKQNELVRFKKKNIEEAFDNYQKYWRNKFFDLHEKEESLNKIFIDAYGLQEELNPKVPLESITIQKIETNIENDNLVFEEVEVFAQFVSYIVGCIFGRYSLDKPGLILANQGETLNDFLKQVPNTTCIPDEDNIIPVLDGEWFKDDIVGRFKAFLKTAFGEEHFEENLNYIEDTIGKDIRKYFVKDFYNDHIKRYKKRPIYWMFNSPKGHFKALIYMHRYQPDLCSKLLNDYLQNFIGKLEAKKQSETRLSLREDISAREKTAALKEIDKLELMLKDCREYEKTLFIIATQKISIDLDDGVKVNYQKFKEVLIPIKGLEKEED